MSPEPLGAIRERLAADALGYPIPARANRLDFMLGALTLVALTLLAFTGIVLTQFYNPAPVAAHGSIQYIVTTLPLVTYLRDVHVWSASAASCSSSLTCRRCSGGAVSANLAKGSGGAGFSCWPCSSGSRSRARS